MNNLLSDERQEQLLSEASNEHEALGEAFNDISSQPDLKDFLLGLHVVVKIDC